MSGIAADIWQSFCRIQGIFLALGSIVFSAILAYAGPNLSVTINLQGFILAYLFALGTFICFLTAVDMVFRGRTEAKSHLPKVFCVIDPHKDSDKEGTVLRLLIEKSPWFSFDGVVSIYHSEFVDSSSEKFEKYVGYGRVLTIQEDGKIQIDVQEMELDYAELWNRLRKNDQAVLRNILVKPAMPWEALEKNRK